MAGRLGPGRIGTQIWMLKNLDVDTYRNGDVIPQVTDDATWASLTTGAWCYYNNDLANGEIYGKLYNWYAVNDRRGLAPIGYHIPSNAEWTTLITGLGGGGSAGGALKEAGITHWQTPNTGATNSNRWTGLPGGIRVYYSAFFNINSFGYWWSSTALNVGSAWINYLTYNNSNIVTSDDNKRSGLSVRCIKD